MDRSELPLLVPGVTRVENGVVFEAGKAGDSRRKLLLESWFFGCACTRCLGETEGAV